MIKFSLTVFLKEIKCILRDKKSFTVGVLIPLILMPAIFFITDISIAKTQVNADNLVISISDANNSFYKFCSRRDDIIIKEVKKEFEDIKNSEIDVHVLVDSNLDQKILNGEPFKFKINYDQSSLSSIVAVRNMDQCELDFRNLIENSEFSSLDQLNEVVLEYRNVKNEDSVSTVNNSLLYFSVLSPLMIMLYCFIGTSNTALELSTGEKERSTWEPLLSTGVHRGFIISGKLLAAASVGFIGALSTTLGLLGYVHFSGVSDNLSIFWVNLIIISLFMSVFIASVTLTLGMYSKTNKEAQTYLFPAAAIFIAPGYMEMSIDINNISFFDLSVPVLNIVCIIKESLSGINNFAHLCIVSFWLILYTFLVYRAACRLIEKENVIFRN